MSSNEVFWIFLINAKKDGIRGMYSLCMLMWSFIKRISFSHEFKRHWPTVNSRLISVSKYLECRYSGLVQPYSLYQSLKLGAELTSYKRTLLVSLRFSMQRIMLSAVSESFTFSLPIWILSISLLWLLWLKLPKLTWIVVVKVGTLVLFLILGEMLSIFCHWG